MVKKIKSKKVKNYNIYYGENVQEISIIKKYAKDGLIWVAELEGSF